MLSRREFLLLTPFLAGLLVRAREARGDARTSPETRYRLEVRILLGLFTFTLTGSIMETIDRAAGWYRVVLAGQGPGIANRLESAGIIRGRRLVPTSTQSFLSLRGRESWTAIAHDHDRGVINYHHVSQTFLLGRRRQVHDVVSPKPGQQVDDGITAALNYAAGALEVDGTATFRTYVVRRTRAEQEGPEDVYPGGYRAEIVPLVVKVAPDPETGRRVASLDLTRFTSWAREGSPARIVLGSDGRPESIEARLALGTTVWITFQPRESSGG